jgi:hypothetical protein
MYVPCKLKNFNQFFGQLSLTVVSPGLDPDPDSAKILDNTKF